jgi:dephospho-CoA kinase
MEEAARNLQCEASMILVDESLAAQGAAWKRLGYEPCQPESLADRAWVEAAKELARPGRVLLFKQMRSERILRPI